MIFVFHLSGCITDGTPRWRRWPLTCYLCAPPLPSPAVDRKLSEFCPLYCKIPFQIFLFLNFFVLKLRRKKTWCKSRGSNFTVWHTQPPVLLLAWQHATLYVKHPPLHTPSSHNAVMWAGSTKGNKLWIKTLSIHNVLVSLPFVFFLIVGSV